MENNVTPNTEENSNVHYCKYCGNPLNDEYRVCLHCGAPNESLYPSSTQEETRNVINDNNHFNPTLIVGLVLSIFIPFVSLIIGTYSLTNLLKIKKENRSKQWKSDFILSIVIIVLSLIMTIYVFTAQIETIDPDEEVESLQNIIKL